MIPAPPPVPAKTVCDRCGAAPLRRDAVWRGRGLAAYRLCLDCALGENAKVLPPQGWG